MYFDITKSHGEEEADQCIHDVQTILRITFHKQALQTEPGINLVPTSGFP